MAEGPREQGGSPRRATVRTEILDRQPPFSLEAELGVLGSILLLPDVCDDVALILRSEDFFDNANRTLFEHMLALHQSNKKIDVTLLVDRLKSAGQFEQIGGAPYLAKVSQSVPNAAHAVYYANIVREKALYRELIETATGVLREAYAAEMDARELVNHAEQQIFSILDSRDSSSVTDIRDAMHLAMDRMEARMQGDHAAGGVETGFPKLDHLTGGLHDSELIILAARPGMGKTALALNIAENVAVLYRIPTLIVSLEMSAIELCDRLLSGAAKVDGFKMRGGSLTQQERQRLVEEAARLSESPLYIDETPNRTVTEIAASARRIHRREGKLGLLVIDYLQLIQPDDPKDPRHEQVAKMTRRLKGLAREMKIPVLCVAQLNRQVESARDTTPRLSHLRESGAIEQDADVVLFVHREAYYHKAEDDRAQGVREEGLETDAKLIVAKQRNGPTGTINLLWQSKFTKFLTPAEDRYEEAAPLAAQTGFEPLDSFGDPGQATPF